MSDFFEVLFKPGPLIGIAFWLFVWWGITEQKKREKNNRRRIVNQPIIRPESNPSNNRDILRYKMEWAEGQHRSLIRGHLNLMELTEDNKVQNINYSDLLSCFEWQYKRFKILFRDKFSCVDCGEISYSLHVHHKFYLVNRLPWEIEDEALVSLCRNCHTKRHQNEKIKVYGNHFNDSRVESKRYFFKICPRCNGTGYLPQFSHVEDGICFLCWGLNINRTIFSNRINYYLQNPLLYNLKSYYEESFDFFEAITLDYYKNNILDRLVTLEELKNRDDLPFGGSDPPNREEVLRNLDLPRTIEQDDNSLLEEDDGLPF